MPSWLVQLWEVICFRDFWYLLFSLCLLVHPGEIVRKHRSTTIFQFQINVGCSRSFSYQHPVLLEYSQDAGLTWKLVQSPCYPSERCQDGAFTDGSIYHSGTFGDWTTVVIPLNKHITATPEWIFYLNFTFIIYYFRLFLFCLQYIYSNQMSNVTLKKQVILTFGWQDNNYWSQWSGCNISNPVMD